MSSLTELTAQIIAARAAKKDMSTEEFQQEMQIVYSFLKGIEEGNVQPPTQAPVEETKPQLTIKQAFKKDEVICMVCSKGGFKTLKRHLTLAHSLKPGEYRKQFGIPSTQSLAAKSYSESRRQMAINKGLGEGLVKFRASAKAKKAAVSAVKVKDALPVVKIKAPVPAMKVKAPVPAIKTKVAVPVVKEKAAEPAKVAKKK
jgi:predicted transcriptional regulator